MADWRNPSKGRKRAIRTAELDAADEATAWLAAEVAKLDTEALGPAEYSKAKMALQLESVRQFRSGARRRLNPLR